MHPDKKFMQAAIDFANKSEYKVAALIVKENKIIAKATTTIKQNKDPTCHAEINVIRIACKKLKSHKLEDCYLYSTFEPCPMCTSACVWAKMKGIIYGAEIKDSTEKYPQRIKINCSKIIKKGTPKLELYPKFMKKECEELLK